MKYVRIIILCFITAAVSGQVTPSLITLNTDRPFYFNGQEILISYHLANFENSLEENAELLYITLIDSNSKPIENTKNLSKNGSGEITISLPNNIKSDLYQIVAFTNYNRNFGNTSFFRLNIPIYNLADNLSKESNKPEIASVRFFPEGGQLVEGVSNRVVYQVQNRYVDSKATLFEGNKIITSFSIPKEGIGNFYFQPDAKKSYGIKFNVDSAKNVSFPLPAVEPEGIAFSVTQRNQALQLILSTSSRAHKNDSVHLVGYASNIRVYESNGALKKGALFTEIAKKNLPPGTVDFFVLDKNQNMVAKRSVFNDFDSNQLNIGLQNTTIPTKTHTQFNITSMDNSRSIVDAKIIPETWLELQPQNIIENLGLRENINHKFINAPFSDHDKQLIDDLLITQSTERKIPKHQTFDKQFIHENYLFLRGQLIDTAPLPDSTTLYFFMPGVNVIYQEKIDATGFFEFPLLFEFYGNQQIPFYPFSEKHEFIAPKINLLEENVTYTGGNQVLTWTDVHEKAKQEFVAQNEIAKVFNFYKEQIQTSKTASPFDINNLIPKPDVEFLMKDYISFESMEDVIKEILNGVMLRSRKGSHTLHMFSEDLQRVYKESPFIFVDNTPTKNIEYLLSINPNQIERIRLINRNEKLRQLGPFGDGGLIVIDLKPNSSNVSSNAENLTFNASGLSEQRKNEAKTTGSNIPDMREVLLWKPNQVMKSGESLNLSFVTSDRPGNYVIVVESISEDGKIGYTTKRFSVHFSGINQNGKLDQE